MFHILVVDDDKNTRMFFSGLLESAGYTVTTSENGADALSIMEKIHIDLVVLDIMMPKMDGYEFTRILRHSNNNLPILMVSAKQLPEDRKRGFLSGIDDYMSKPLDNEELLLHIKALLRRVSAANEQRLEIGEVILDYATDTVTRKEESMIMPQKEFRLLFKLLSSPDKIFTRIQLMDEIWGYDCETGTDTVTVHISRLRKRFESYTEFEIKSIKGLGYKAIIKV